MSTPQGAPASPDGGGALRLALPARMDQLHQARHAVADWARRLGVGDPTVGDVALAVDEAVANAAEHAYVARTPGTVVLEAAITGDELEVTVRDDGRWRPDHAQADRGRGLLLIQQVSSRCTVRSGGDGTVVSFVVPLG